MNQSLTTQSPMPPQSPSAWFLLAIMPAFGFQGGASAAAAAAQSTPDPSKVSVGGITLRSVNVDIPNPGIAILKRPGADVVNEAQLSHLPSPPAWF